MASTPRRPRIAPGGLVYHVLNRGVARLALFEKEGDYETFERVLSEALIEHPTRLLGYCIMPNHWHLVLWPRKEGELTEFLRNAKQGASPLTVSAISLVKFREIPETYAMCYSILARGMQLSLRSTLVLVTWFGLALVGLGNDPAAKTDGDSRDRIERFAKGYELFLGADKLPLEMQPEPVLRWPNATRDTREGATFVWTLNGRPEAIGCVWENGGYWAHAFHSLSGSKLIAQHNSRTFWQPEKAGIEFSRLPEAPEPADSAAKRLSQMKDLARRFQSRLPDADRKSEELRLLPRPLYRYKTERKDLIDGALFAFVQGTDPEMVLVLEAARRDGKSEWRYALTRRTGMAVEADLDGKTIWSLPVSNGAPDAAWFIGRLGMLN